MITRADAARTTRDSIMQAASELCDKIEQAEGLIAQQANELAQEGKMREEAVEGMLAYKKRAEAAEAWLQNMKVQIIQIHAQDNYDTAGSMFEALVKEVIEGPQSDYFQRFVADKPHPLMSATGSEGRCELCGLRESQLHDAYEASK